MKIPSSGLSGIQKFENVTPPVKVPEKIHQDNNTTQTKIISGDTTDTSGYDTGDAEGNFPLEIDEAYDENNITNTSEHINIYDNPGDSATKKYDRRIEMLSGMKQLDDISFTENDESRCGCTSLVAGAIMAGGADGLKTLIGSIMSSNYEMAMSTGKPGLSMKTIKEISDKIDKKQPLTREDISLVEDSLYKLLNEKESREIAILFPEGSENRKAIEGDGLTYKVISDFIEQNKSLGKMFRDNGVGFLGTDTDGDGEENHAVMTAQPPGYDVVFDPWPKKEDTFYKDLGLNNLHEGSQVIQDKEIVDLYFKKSTTVWL